MLRTRDFRFPLWFGGLVVLSLAATANAQQTAADVAHALEGKDTPDEQAQQLIRLFRQHNSDGAYDEICSRLRKLSASALPTICMQQDLSHNLAIEPGARIALGIVLFPEEDTKNIKKGLAGDARRSFAKPCVLELLHALQDPQTKEGAIFALGYCSLATNGAVASELLKYRDGLKSVADRKSFDETLVLVCARHTKRAFDDIDDCISRKKFTLDVLEKRHRADIAAVHAYKPVLDDVVFITSALEPFFVSDETLPFKQKFARNLSKPIENEAPQDDERARAIAIWTKAIEDVELKTPLRQIFMKKAKVKEVRILRLDSLLMQSVIDKRTLPGFGGMEFLGLKEQAAEAGRLAEDQAILVDLKQAFAEYDKVMDLYLVGTEGVALSKLTEEEKQIVRMHKLVQSKSLAESKKEPANAP